MVWSRTASVRWWLIAVLLAATAIRLLHLPAVPPGFQFDEAHNALDAARVLEGQRPIFFTDNGGREPLNIYLQAGALALLGEDHVVVAIRLVSALAGLVTVALVCAFAARLFADRSIGLLAAGFLAVTYWHVHFSRYAIRAIFAPLWAVGALWAWWVAVSPRDQGASDTPPRGGTTFRLYLPPVVCGLCLAGAVYSHPSGRLLPLVLLGHAAYRTLADRRSARATWRALLVAGATALVLFLPLGQYFLAHPGQFTAHPSDVSLGAVAAAHYGGSIARALLGQIAAIGGMLFVTGDPSTLHNLPGLPVFDPLTALLAVLGLGVLAGWLLGSGPDRRDRAVLLCLWLVVGLVPTLLSDRAPNYSRAMVALPAIVMLPALGLGWARDVASDRWRRLVGPAAAVAIALGGLWTGYHYFVTFPRLPQTYYSYDVEKLDAWRALTALSDQAQVFLHPLWMDHATVAFLNREKRVRRLDGRDTIVLPADGRDAVVAFPAKEAQREEWYDQAKTLYGGVAARSRITDALGAPLLRILRVPASAAGDMAPPRDAPLEPEVFVSAKFGGALRLVGYTAGPARPGEVLPIVLAWRTEEPTSQNLTVFVHLVGPGGEPLGQDDREPAHASYRTSRWRPGETIIDRFSPILAAGARGPVSVQVGLYDQTTGERMKTSDDLDAVNLKPIPLEAPGSAP
jgi:hypothetical protein